MMCQIMTWFLKWSAGSCVCTTIYSFVLFTCVLHIIQVPGTESFIFLYSVNAYSQDDLVYIVRYHVYR